MRSSTVAKNSLELPLGYCFKVIGLVWVSGGNSLGKLGWFPDLGIHSSGLRPYPDPQILVALILFKLI